MDKDAYSSRQDKDRGVLNVCIDNDFGSDGLIGKTALVDLKADLKCRVKDRVSGTQHGVQLSRAA